MPGWEDYYKILDVSPEANDEEIKEAYRDKCFILHPDRMVGVPKSAQLRAQEELKKVIRAYDVLKDPVKRQWYHQEWLKRHEKPPTPPPGPRPPPSPAEIVLSNFYISPQSIQLGGSINISVVAINSGHTAASKTVVMNGDFTGSQTITLKPGARGIAKFTITPKTIGNFNVSIGLFTGSFSVTAKSPSGEKQPPLHIPLERFSKRARESLMLAEEEANLQGRGYVETKHLLLALLRQKQTRAAKLLNTLGINGERVQSPLEKSIVENNDGKLSKNVKRAIELAIIEHRRMNDSYVRTEHLLLGLIREEKGNAAKILEGLGINRETVIAELAFARTNPLSQFWFRITKKLNRLIRK
jgi:curved DNA-binding protein CbpA